MLQTFAFTVLSTVGVEVPSRVDEVTVYPGSALVTRVAELETRNGEFTITGLPWSLDPNNLRIRVNGADLVGMEMRERHVAAAPSARVEELRRSLQALERERAGLDDDRATLEQVQKHLQRLLDFDATAHDQDVKTGKASPQSWGENLAFLTRELATNRKALRDNQWQREELEVRLEDLRRELGACTAVGGVDQRDLVLDLIGSGAGGAKVAVDYIVGNAGWRPLYDLRAAKDARSVELAYRAQVWQASGEDWSDVGLLLSTARPSLGAQGPEPSPKWLRLFDPRPRRGDAPATAEMARESDLDEKKLAALGYLDKDTEALSPFASVDDQGLSARFRLARRESIQSRNQPTLVLIGQTKLDSTPEYVCVPELDDHVWLRGRAKNTSEWTMLPGEASVYCGADFLGKASLAAVETGQEFTLHLGADPAFTVERIQRVDEHQTAGVFSRDAAEHDAWTIRLKNHGAASVAADGSAQVFVREALPRGTDERITIELVDVSQEPAKGERWKKDRDELGIVTWALRVPKDGECELRYGLKIAYPESLRISE
ncbi:MAG: mucoidy inhibitor MuiA family protein [Planctomycetes bacterium]|nr:mucoidy inhibitor MuiA family protein [Planctomycetota bacterium]